MELEAVMLNFEEEEERITVTGSFTAKRASVDEATFEVQELVVERIARLHR